MADRGPRKFLCVIDDTPEGRVAIRFAARRAEHTLGKVALLYVIEPPDFREWKAVEARMREEAYKEAERALYEAAAIVNQVSGGRPELIIREGDAARRACRIAERGSLDFYSCPWRRHQAKADRGRWSFAL